MVRVGGNSAVTKLIGLPILDHEYSNRNLESNVDAYEYKLMLLKVPMLGMR